MLLTISDTSSTFGNCEPQPKIERFSSEIRLYNTPVNGSFPARQCLLLTYRYYQALRFCGFIPCYAGVIIRHIDLY